MSKLPESVKQAWNDREGPVVLTTVSIDGVPNTIYVLSIKLSPDGYWVVADNKFDKTRCNILQGGCGGGCLLFITKAGKSFQVKGRLEYHKDGPIFDDMKTWNPERLPGVAALVLVVQEVFTGAERIF